MSEPAATHSPSLLRNRNFVLLWAAYAVSAMGDHLSEMGLLEMQGAMHRDDSTRIKAIILFAFMAPFFALGPVMGWLADRLPRKWIMITADVVRAGLMFSLFPLLQWLTRELSTAGLWVAAPAGPTAGATLSPWVYAAPLLVTGVFAAMFSPSRSAMLPTLVREDQIIRANALTNALGPIATIASYFLGGYLVQRFGVHRNFQVDAATFLASALLILCIRPPPPRAVAGSGDRGLGAGFRYVRDHRRVAELVGLAVVFWIAASVVNCVVPAVVKGVFGGTIQDVGTYQGTLGIGLLSGALLLSVLNEALRPQIAATWSLVLSGLAVAWLAAVAGTSVGGRAGGYVGLFAVGFFGSGVLVGTNALMQKVVPDFFRGRVFGVNDFCSMAGLLAATGLLGIPDWPAIDRAAPAILAMVALTMIVVGAASVRVRLRRGRFTTTLNFWYSLNYLYCRAWLGVRRVGRCTIPGSGPVIVAANHTSSVDPLLLLATSPNRYISYMIAREYYETAVLGPLVRLVQCVPVNRSGVDTASVRAALRHLSDGKILGIFPQGRIMPPDDAGPPRDGVGMLALRSGATVIPAYITGVEHTDSMLRPALNLKRLRAEVRYGPPVDLSPWSGREKDRAAYAEAAEAIMAAIRGLRP